MAPSNDTPFNERLIVPAEKSVAGTLRLSILFVAELIAVAILRIPSDLGFTAFAFADRGSWLTLVAYTQKGQRPGVDFGYTYGLLPIWLSSGWFHLFGATPYAYQAANWIGTLLIGWAIARTLSALRVPLLGIALMVVALPFAVQSSYPSIALLVEAVLLSNAIAEHASGRRNVALALAAAACFAKPAMGYVYGFILTIFIISELYRTGALKPSRMRWELILAEFAPAAATMVVLAALALVINGPRSLFATILPISGAKHYAAFDYGFFRGRGKFFWQGMPPIYYFASVVVFWFAASGWLIIRALSVLPRWVRDKSVRDEIIVATAIMHILFITLFFAGPSAWISYSYVLVIGAVVACTMGRVGRFATVLLILLAAIGQTGVCAASWTVWKQRSPDTITAGLWATKEVRTDWEAVREIAGKQDQGVAILSPQGVIPLLFPEFEQTPYVYLLAGVTLDSEISAAEKQLDDASIVAKLVDPDYGWALTLMPQLTSRVADRPEILKTQLFAVYGSKPH